MRFETRGLGKSFGGIYVLKDIDFSVEGGRCHAIVGANGAGKSTFINVVSGVFEDYEGEVLIDGREVRMQSPAIARRYKVGCVHQDFDQALFRDLTLLENVLLPLHAGRSMHWRRFPNARVWEEARDVLRRVGLEPTMDEWRRPIQSFRPAFRQKVAIATVLAQGAKLVIFDEPTSSLGHDDANKLLQLIRQLKAQGIAVIYISHHLSEVTAIADEISVFRSGRKVASFAAGTHNLAANIVQHMLNRQVDQTYPERVSKSPGTTVLRLHQVTVPMHLRDVNLDVRHREILGITGLVGAGKSSLIRLLYGMTRPVKGHVEWEGEPLKRYGVRDAIRRGVYMVPEDRRNQGLLIDESISYNLTLPSLPLVRSKGFISQRKESAFAQAVSNQVRLTAYRFDMSAARLSGGNQQKIAIGKWIAKSPKVLLLDEPTKGIDVGAKMEIYRLLQNMAADGTAVVIASSEPEEVLGVADRVAVMRAGAITDVRPVEEWSLDEVLLHATGGITT